MKRILKIISLTALMASIPTEVGSQTNPQIVYGEKFSSIDSVLVNSLVENLRKKGFGIEEFFLRPEFEIHPDIDSLFINSAESKALKAYKAASKEEKAKIFEDEYQKYKEKLGFDGKTKQIKPFIKNNLEHLLTAEKEYQIPKEVIAATLGVESDFGKNKGKYYAFNAYVSLYLTGYKQEFAISQLKELLKFCERTKKDIFIKSSYAGAIGYVQFLPYSLNKWFIGDDVYNMHDNILSTANYLAYFMKKTGSLEKAVLRYNPSDVFVKAVFDLAEHGKGI